ncbi:MAG: hypothetical protein UT65_C0014G0009 [Parcubacteria group bacterium GW2011_GWF2_39_8b]|uniref:Uncharacterized protein n=2 Tax=Candidatus Zambryskiibacteriota TaxID=1817925 RepID=A0A1G2T7Z5_9BACT|nr:MAG: hypothetical protein UT65_C0014G0009 [Parcubacteria group bacterium GW2011_GWF2_39_8b]KKR45913.1 MAG: hypothetical protein UT81_C0004G0011 [Parcubacteria group bacterium GW2011_GWA2_40_14]OHA92741.1 MAG: hypothetical protein A2W58_03125 [Candidatus Zambryskibacteria bacterium RIFCSPHIGHO2_02_38_10.5]OHA97088.1 MAG: hypothetical protein A3C63_00735 [Candidatus Zambryskibacteria bacterium RIFCSPHIGHO2_02_FULL_39_82]OHA99739.1 MAG: hypothetical protein A3E32_00700 [Candidatus Zambryskibact
MEQETFWTLFYSLPHWEFEIFLMIIFDVLIGVLIWPKIKKFTKHHKSDDERMADLEREVDKLKSKL